MSSRFGRAAKRCVLMALIAHAVPAFAGTVLSATTPEGTTAPLPNVFPAIPTAPEGAPNILLVLTDDVGFGAASAFGGPVPTPNLERLARDGLRYNRFHTTAMCSPTRAALLTGRNHHAVGTGTLTDFALGAPGYDAMIPRSAATIARLLQDNGYNTAFIGKHHNVPKGPFSSSGPYDYFPTKLGFDHFFGFIGSDTDQWRPTLYRDTTRIIGEKPPTRLLDERFADDAIHWIHQQKAAAPDKPFFIYFAPGSAHTPHQAPADWIKRFRAVRAGVGQAAHTDPATTKGDGLGPGADFPPRPARLYSRLAKPIAARASLSAAADGSVRGAVGFSRCAVWPNCR